MTAPQIAQLGVFMRISGWKPRLLWRGGKPARLVGVDVGEPLAEEERRDALLVLGRINGAVDGACRISEPGFG